jgi:hypothetical protein
MCIKRENKIVQQRQSWTSDKEAKKKKTRYFVV